MLATAMAQPNQPVFRIHLGDLYPIELDLGAWHEQFSGVAGALTRVNGLIFSARNLWVDDLTVAVGSLERSWQVIPGAAIRGVLGAQTGAAGAIDVTDGQNCNQFVGRILDECKIDRATQFPRPTQETPGWNER